MDLEATRTALADAGLDGWLFYDFRGSDPIGRAVLGMAGLIYVMAGFQQVRQNQKKSPKRSQTRKFAAPSSSSPEKTSNTTSHIGYTGTRRDQHHRTWTCVETNSVEAVLVALPILIATRPRGMARQFLAWTRH